MTAQTTTAIGIPYVANGWANVPHKGTPGAAAYDLKASEDVTIPPGKVAKVPTGLSMEIPPGYYGEIRPRSGLASKGIVGILGTIDADYRGEIMGLLHNTTDEPFTVSPGDRIAQFMVLPMTGDLLFVPVAKLGATERGTGGFGSTGV